MATYNTTGSKAGMPSAAVKYVNDQKKKTTTTTTTTTPKTSTSSSKVIVGNVSGKNGMPSNVPGGGTAYLGGNTTGKNGMPSNVPGGGTTYGTSSNSTAKPATYSSSGSSSYSTPTSQYANFAYSDSDGNEFYGDSGWEQYQALLQAQNAAQQAETQRQIDAANAAQKAYEAYLAQIKAQEEAERTRAEEAERQKKLAAQNAYDKNMSYLNSAYDTQLGNLKSNYDSALGQLNSTYNNSANDVTQDAANSLQEAYINRMIGERGLNQALSAQGITGGASETTLANLYNNYGNARNNIERTKASNLTKLAGIRDSSLAEALQQYNNQVSDANARKLGYAMDLETALANNEISATGDYQNALTANNSQYLNALTNAIGSLSNYTYDATQANNQAVLNNVMQNAQNAARAQALYNASQEKKYQEQADEYAAASKAASSALANTYGNTQNNYLQAVLNSIRG